MPCDVDCSGRLTISEAEGLREKILAAFAECEEVALDCSGATDVDVAFIEILLASRKTAAATGRRLSLKAPTNGVVADAVRRAGLPADELVHLWAS